jgi:hypothetical protein
MNLLGVDPAEVQDPADGQHDEAETQVTQGDRLQ